MKLTKLPTIATAVYIINLTSRDEKIRFRQAEVESVFSGFVNGQSQQTNVPDQADPTQPRIMFGNETKAVALSQVACQLQMNFAQSHIEVSQQITLIRKNASEFYRRTVSIFGEQALGQSGLVIDVTYPSDQPTEALQEYLASQLYSGPRFGEIASALITIGFKISDLFLNLSGSVYETRHFESSFPNKGFINLDTLPVTERGLLFKIDVNDRPRQKPNQYRLTSADEFLEVIENFMIKGDFLKFSGLELTS